MSKREAKRWACGTVAAFIDEYMAAGQPWDDHECEHDCIECLRKVTGLKQLQREMDRRAKAFGEPSQEPAEGCPWCAKGWSVLGSISKTQPKRHAYPADYKGQRAGFPYCTAEPAEGKGKQTP